MNTTKKGDAFEAHVKTIIEQLLATNSLPINCQYSKVYSKKGYYSEQRKNNIIVDLSVECTLPNEKEPSMYLIIECKDYAKPIPVDDIEEFHAKLRQITGLNVKAIFFTTSTLQKSALNYAIAHKIRVMKINKSNTIETLSFKKEHTNSRLTPSKAFANAILTLTGSSLPQQRFIGISNAKSYMSIEELLVDTISSIE